jgi:predicted RNA binding protein YcfA (HicA-like mRNA interferase family)
MPQLPIISGKELVKILSSVGYKVVRQRGSHMRLSCGGKKSVTVPNYKSIDRSLLIKILRDAEISADDFMKLM